MHATAGRTLTVVHLLVACSLALPAVVILLLVIVEAPRDPEMHWLLAVIITTPIWLAGLVAAVEVVRVIRRRRVSRIRAATFAGVAIVGGAVLAWTQGVFRFFATLADRPADVDIGWPVSIIWTPDRLGTDAFHLDSAGIWLAVLWLVLGAASLLALARDIRGRRADEPGTAVPAGAAR